MFYIFCHMVWYVLINLFQVLAKILSHNLGIIYFLLPTTNFLALAPINNAIILLIAHKLGRGVFILQIGSWFIAQNSCFTFSKMLLTSWLTQRFPMENQNQTFTFFVHFFSIYLYKECKTCCFRKSQILQIYIGPQLFLYCSLYMSEIGCLFIDHWPFFTVSDTLQTNN